MDKRVGCIYGVLAYLVIGLSMTISSSFVPSGTGGQGSLWLMFFNSEDANFNVLQGKLDSFKQSEGDFSFKDMVVLGDKEKLIKAKLVVEGTVKAYNESFDAQKNVVDGIKSGYKNKYSPALQKAYDAVAEDFKNLKDIETGYGKAMIAYLDFVIANNGVMEVSPDGVSFRSQELADKFNALEKKASEATTSLHDDKDRIRDKLGFDFGVFADEFVKK